MSETAVGYFEDESRIPVYDNAKTCAVCGQSLEEHSPAVVVLPIYCTRWPLATFVRVHAHEAQMSKTQRQEIIVTALEARDRLEKTAHKPIPDVFRGALS